MLKKATGLLLMLASCIVLFFHDSKQRTETCGTNEFRISPMSSCYPNLGCGDLKNITFIKLIGFGAVKAVYLAVWNKISVAVSFLRDDKFKSDFLNGLRMLHKYRNNPFVVKLIGECSEKNWMITEYHRHGNAVDIIDKFKRETENVQVRLKLCLDYARILETLHNESTTITVNCDSNDLNKTLSQLLITDNFTLILNDVDALAELANGFVKCGSKPIFSTFVPPEQRNIHGAEMVGYNEKTDIWKAAIICDYFLGKLPHSVTLRYRLFELHRKCSSSDPSLRPKAHDLVTEYSRVMFEVENGWL